MVDVRDMDSLLMNELSFRWLVECEDNSETQKRCDYCSDIDVDGKARSQYRQPYWGNADGVR